MKAHWILMWWKLLLLLLLVFECTKTCVVTSRKLLCKFRQCSSFETKSSKCMLKQQQQPLPYAFHTISNKHILFVLLVHMGKPFFFSRRLWYSYRFRESKPFRTRCLHVTWFRRIWRRARKCFRFSRILDELIFVDTSIHNKNLYVLYMFANYTHLVHSSCIEYRFNWSSRFIYFSQMVF